METAVEEKRSAMCLNAEVYALPNGGEILKRFWTKSLLNREIKTFPAWWVPAAGPTGTRNAEARRRQDAELKTYLKRAWVWPFG